MINSLILPHEHVFCRYRSADKSQALAFVAKQMEMLYAKGVTDIVDLTVYTNPLSYREFVEASPVRIHSSVGFYLEPYVRKENRSMPVEDLVAVLDRKQRRLASLMPPLAIKVAARSGSLSSFERRAFSAVAQFHHKTGLPIVTHSSRGFEEHQGFLMDAGVPASSIMLSHPEMSIKGRFAISIDSALASMARCAARGSYLCITDLTSLTSRADAVRLQLVLALVADGHANRLVVSGDSSWKVHRGVASVRNSSPAKDFRLALEVHEKLELSGVCAADRELIIRENPIRFYGLPPR